MLGMTSESSAWTSPLSIPPRFIRRGRELNLAALQEENIMYPRKPMLTFGLTIGSLLMAPAQADAQGGAAPRTGHIPASDGVNYYYEIQGQGEPLLWLHGGLMSIDLSRPMLQALARQRQVIAVDLQGHGRTTLGDRPIDLIRIADDLAMVLKTLGYDSVDVMGYSFGGGAGFRLAVQHPELVRRLVIVSAPFSQDGFYPEMLPQQAAVGAGMLEAMKQTPMYQSYARVAPHPEDFPRLLDGSWANTCASRTTGPRM
jgi:pimeloyl-ACP methyl ester carboxylesterase